MTVIEGEGTQAGEEPPAAPARTWDRTCEHPLPLGGVCGEPFVATHARHKFCERHRSADAMRYRAARSRGQEKAERSRRNRSMASMDSGRTGDQAARRRRGAEQADEQAARARISEADLDAALARVRELAVERFLERSDHDSLRGFGQGRQRTAGELDLIRAVKAIGPARSRSDWPRLAGALIEVSAVAALWSVRAGSDEPEFSDPDPPEPTAAEVVPAAPREGDGAGELLARRMAESYADILLGRAGDDLEGGEARATIERLLGVGL